ncbi:MAG TPA: SemiSWEET transporter [Rhizomicrobium sp.]|nr:SemiSWEET transporter [Rhizomicrobium sp.]
MNYVVIVGALAAICSTVSFVPQAWKIIRSGETKDISVGMYALTVAAFALWCGYGVALDQWPLIVANGICLMLSAFILAMTLLPGGTKRAVAKSIKK